MGSKQHKWLKEHVEYLRKHAPNHTERELHEKFNKHFSLSLTDKQIKGIRYRKGIRVGKFERPTAFKKGHIPWSKGKKGLDTNGGKGRFQGGIKAPKWKPVGSESLSDGYVVVKVKEPDVWKRKHYLVWEGEYGKVPEGHLVIFADGNKSNFDIGNLILVSRGQLRRLHHHHDMKKGDPRLAKTMLNVVKIHEAIDERSK